MDIKTQCKYFLHGACSRGETCLYIHDLEAKPDNICKFYQNGSCMYGKNCRYDHIRKTKATPPVTNTKTTSTPKTLKSIKDLLPKEVTAAEWYDAPVFVPGQSSHNTSTSSKEDESFEGGSYSSVASTNAVLEGAVEEYVQESGVTFSGQSNELLCPFAAVRECPYGDSCEYLHGDVCDMCGCQCLHPDDNVQRTEHEQLCLEHHEREMEIAFAAQRSSGVSCAICLDVVLDNPNISERVFGILENCNHPFCLNCIRKWRASSSAIEKQVIRACPICRVNSFFVTPSNFWVEDESEKQQLIENYKEYLGSKHCRNYDRGRGICQFGNSCFYSHVNQDGSVEDSKPDLRHMEDSDGQAKVVKTPRLSEFIATRD